MSQPSVNITQRDGALGVLPANSGKLFALAGVSSIGTANVPATYARIPALTAALGTGPLVEAAARHIQKTGKPVLVVKTAAATNVGAYGTPVDGITGTSNVTFDTDYDPFDDYDFVFTVVAGGTIGTAGITYKYSTDGGLSYSPVTALGTANSLAIAAYNIGLDFGAGTLVAADTISVRCSAPRWDDTELLAALNALKASLAAWDLVYVVGDVGATSAGVIETWATGLAAAGKYRGYLCNARLPLEAESEATYLSSLSTAFTSFVTTTGAVGAGAARIVSSVDGKSRRRPIIHAVASAIQALSEEVDISAIDVGALAGVQLADDLGNPLYHDESLNPGLDDARFLTLRTWDLEPGVFVNNPRLKSSPSSDFEFIQHRRVMNIALEVVDAYMRRRLSKAIRVKPDTGFIFEADAAEMESGLTAALNAALLAKPKASAISVAISRTDNMLSTKTLTVDVSVVPLAYPKTITASVGFANPALAAATA